MSNNKSNPHYPDLFVLYSKEGESMDPGFLRDTLARLGLSIARAKDPTVPIGEVVPKYDRVDAEGNPLPVWLNHADMGRYGFETDELVTTADEAWHSVCNAAQIPIEQDPYPDARISLMTEGGWAVAADARSIQARLAVSGQDTTHWPGSSREGSRISRETLYFLGSVVGWALGY